MMRRLRQIGLGLIVALGLLVLLGGVGAVYESVAEAADAKAHPPPGRMIDVGGHRLHINCVGAGSPTVVIEAGLGDSSLSWSSWVQPAAGRTTRVCAYDRAGMGYSDPGPLPRTAERFAAELHTLLLRADERGPYVLVGHSLGGLPVRVFAHQYSTDVVGVVLIDSMSPSSAKQSAPDSTEQSDAPSVVEWLLTLPARTGLLRLLAGPLQLTADSFTPRALQAGIDESKGIPDSLAQAGAVRTFGALPLIVLSRGLVPGKDQEWQQWQTELLDLSSNSQQLFADKSGHSIHLDQPEAAVGAIDWMVERIRAQTFVATH
jgi:pimeloyl-ACP methyl ester carboxylesterase